VCFDFHYKFEIFLFLQRTQQDISTNLHKYSRKVPRYSCHILMKREFSRRGFREISRKTVQREPRSSMLTDTHMTKLRVVFRSIANSPKKTAALLEPQPSARTHEVSRRNR
jgi:hypothetical protein